MGGIEGNKVFDDTLIKAPLELSKNIDILIGTVEKLVGKLKSAESAMGAAKSTREIRKENSKLLDSQKEIQKIEKQITTGRAKLIASRSKEAKQLAELKVQTTERNKKLREEAKAARGLIGAFDKLNKERTEAKKLLRDLIAGQKASNEEILKAQKAFDGLDESVRKANKAVGDGTLDVGKYEDGIRAATEGNEAFRGSAAEVLQNFIQIGNEEGGVRGFFQTFVSGIRTATKAGLRFIATPIGAVIAAIVAGIAAITAVIQRNESASDKFNEVWKATTAILDVVAGRIIKLITAFGKFLSGDFEGAANDASDAFSNLGDSILEAGRRGVLIARLTVEVEKLNTVLKVTESALDGQIRKFEILADDATRSFKEREAAAEDARKLNILLAQEREDVARKELLLVNEQIKQAIAAGTINRALRDQEADAIAKFVRAQSEALATELDNEKTRRELRQDRLERDLDILIDGFDNIKTINDRIIEDEDRVLNKRIDTFNKLVSLSDSSFEKQIETIKKFTKVAFDENELLAEQDAVILNEKIRQLGLSEIIEGRLLEIVRERRIVLSEAADLERELTKAIADQNDIRELDSLMTESAITDNQLSELDKRIKNHKDANKAIANADLEAQEQREAIIQKSVEFLSESTNRFSDLRIQRISDELTAVEFARDRELEKVRGNKRAEAEINKRFDDQRRDLQRKQANTEKANALFQIALNTAVGIASALKNPATAPVIIPFVIAAGAVQAAVVLAQPVPQFDKGSEKTPADYVAGEKRPELRKSKGKWSLVDKPTLFTGSAGDTIIGGAETNEMLGTLDDLKAPNLLSSSQLMSGLNQRKPKGSNDLINEFKRGNDRLIRTIKNKPTANISVHRSRTDVEETFGNVRRNRLDAYYRGRV